MTRILLLAATLAIPLGVPRELPPVRPGCQPSAQLRCWRGVVREGGDAALYRIAYRESRFQADAVNPKSGAAGWFQFMPTTWRYARAGAGLPADSSPYNPDHAVRAAAWLYSQPDGPKHWGMR